jgi:hypothetical protein
MYLVISQASCSIVTVAVTNAFVHVISQHVQTRSAISFDSPDQHYPCIPDPDDVECRLNGVSVFDVGDESEV